jgi:hypothetical protein
LLRGRFPGYGLTMKFAVLGVPIALILMGAAPAVAPVRERIVAQAQAINPATLSFDRTTNQTRKGGGTSSKLTTLERWDGKRWTLVAVNGKRPTAAEKREREAAAAAAPVPGYHQLASIVAAATETRVDDQGRTVLMIPILPANSVRTDSGDISSHLRAEATLAETNGQIWVEQVRVTEREPFKLNVLIKVLEFERVDDYRLGSDGKPQLASQSADSMGSMFGISGGETNMVTYAYR